VHDLLLMLLAMASTVFAAPLGDRPPPTPLPKESGLESEAPPGAAAGRVPPERVLVVGDSLAVGTRVPLEQALPGTRVETSAERGRTTAEGVAEIAARSPLPAVLVVSLGTNDDPSAVEAYQGQVETVLRAAGPTACVVWPNIVRPPYGGVGYDGYNRALASLAAANPNLVVVDWVALTAANPRWMAPDGVHATPEGYAGRARAIADAVRNCFPR
jgi:lysophospholipase L1-like esterase